MKNIFVVLLLMLAGLESQAQTDDVVVAQPDTLVTTDAETDASAAQTTVATPQTSASKPQATAAKAQDPQPVFGYLSYDSALVAMPQLAIVEKQMSDLQQAYDAEMKRVEDDFNQKYEAFLDGRKDFPRTILLKRQTELQQLLQQNIEFKAQCRQEMEKARREAMVPLQGRLAEAIATVARRHKLALVVNTDANACPFIEPALALDLNDEVRQLLRRGR